jgi:hypothetical protein
MDSSRLDRLFSSEINFDLKNSFTKAWGLYKSQALLYVTFMFFILSIQGMFLFYLKDFMILYSLVLAPPLTTGFFLVANKTSLGFPVRYADFFGGFKFWFLMISIWLIGQILVALGLIALVIPGIYLAVSYLFAPLFGVFGGFDFWTSLELSRKLVLCNFWKFFTLFLILIGMNMLAAAFILISPQAGFMVLLAICVTLPMTFLVIYVVFEELTTEFLHESDPIHESKP